jgi:uncharacterized protein YfaP (DUF2135 family)
VPAASLARRPGPPAPTVNRSRDSEQQRYLESRDRGVRYKRLGSWLLALGAAAALLVAILAGLGYYAADVLRYAPLDDALRVERSGADPDRIALVYRPLAAGTVAFRRQDEGRETELLDQVFPAADDAEQRFEWRLTGVQEGDLVHVTYRRGFALTTAELAVPAAPPRPPLGHAAVAGEVVDATSNRPVEGAAIHLVGTGLRAATDAEGQFRIADAPAGPVALEIAADGFSTEQIEQELADDAETAVRVALSPGLAAGQIRLVLTWDKSPADLDAHLEGPLRDGGKFHIYFQAKGDLASQEFVSLDVDDRDGQGPETITLLGVIPGTYHYFVHDFTNHRLSQSDALARSQAEVRVYQGAQSYRFRANNESTGNVWHVCDIVVDGSGATVQRVDTYETRRLEQEIRLDKFGNPEGDGYGLLADGEAAGQRLLAWTVDGEVAANVFTDDNPLWEALRKKGFEVTLRSEAFDPAWLTEADQFWVFAGLATGLTEDGYQAVVRYIEEGHGVYLAADNYPYLVDAAELARRLYGATMTGDYIGMQIGAVRGRGLPPEDLVKFGSSFEFEDHPLLSGLNFLYEGATVSHIEPNDQLEPVLMASDGQILAAAPKDAAHRVLLDCGWTRYYYGPTEDYRLITKTAGTVRYAENIAGFLMGKGR